MTSASPSIAVMPRTSRARIVVPAAFSTEVVVLNDWTVWVHRSVGFTNGSACIFAAKQPPPPDAIPTPISTRGSELVTSELFGPAKKSELVSLKMLRNLVKRTSNVTRPFDRDLKACWRRIFSATFDVVLLQRAFECVRGDEQIRVELAELNITHSDLSDVVLRVAGESWRVAIACCAGESKRELKLELPIED